MSNGRSFFSTWNIPSLFRDWRSNVASYSKEQKADAKALIGAHPNWVLIEECRYDHPVVYTRIRPKDDLAALEGALRALGEDFVYDDGQKILAIKLAPYTNEALMIIEGIEGVPRVARREVRDLMASLDPAFV